MKRVVSILILTLLFFSLPSTSMANGFSDVTVSQAKIMIDSNPFLVVLDVRTQSEYDSGHIRNAKLIPVAELETRLDELDMNDEILVYCHSGGRSSTASQLLADNGFLHVYNMLGGITAWISAGYPVYVKYSSIQEAINNANEGDTIFVSSGIYYEHLNVNKSLTFVGENKDTTIIDGTNNGTVVKAKADNVSISGFTIRESGCACAGYSGVYVENHHQNVNITNNFIIQNGYGIKLDWGYNIIVAHNNITNNTWGIHTLYSSNNGISDNNIIHNIVGVGLEESSDSVVFGNNITNNDVGIELWYYSLNNRAYENNMTNNGIGVRLRWYSDHNIICGNNITNNLGSGVWLYSCSNNTVSGNIIASNNEGIELHYSLNNTISENNVTNNAFGVHLESSLENSVSENTLKDNDYGIILTSGGHNTICANTISSNFFEGISIGNSNNNIIFGNTITSHGECGINLWESSTNNLVYHNNFINNTMQVEYPGINTIWDNGYPSGGNYWSNHTGIDLFNGPHQNVTGGDGIGDTSHPIDIDNQDHYSLMNRYPCIHDVAVKNATLSKTVVGQGLTTKVRIDTTNQGHFIETFNMTLYANETIIDALTNITLTSGNSTIVTFTWNTTGFAKGNYTISANVTQVPNEAYKPDNAYSNGWVEVTIAGDIDGSGKVDLTDLFLFGKAWMSKPGDPNWNPNADLDGSDKVDLTDLFIFGKNWMKEA